MARETLKNEKPKEGARKDQASQEDIRKQERADLGKEEGKAKEAREASGESMYSAGELADNAKKIFACRKECVAAALKAAGKAACTLSEAKEIVSEFLGKEVS